MKTEDLNDDLKPEYDLQSLRVRKVGEGRRLMNQVQPMLMSQNFPRFKFGK